MIIGPRYVLMLLMGLLMVGCSTTGPGIPDATLPSLFPNHSATQVLDQLTPPPGHIDGLYAKTSVKVRSPEQRAGFTANISHRRDDSLYMSVKVTLGIEAARALVTSDSFYVYDRVKKKLYVGDLSQASNHLPIPVSGTEILQNLLGYLVPDKSLEWNLTAGLDTYTLTSDESGESYVVDPTIWRVTDYTRTDADQIQEYRKYSDFRTRDDVVLPGQIEFGQPEKETSASIRFRSVDLNPDELNFTLRVSDSAERVSVD